MLASRNGHLEVVRLLLRAGADPGVTSESGATALRWATRAGNAEVVEVLKRAGAKD
jgi:ankyrin repeat protein